MPSPSPRKARAPADSSDRRELEDLLRRAAEFFQANRSSRIKQFSTNKSPSAAYATAER
jgi:hypothetical protein